MTPNAVKPTKILLATDFSESASCAFPYAVALAKQHDSELLLLHVITGYADYAKDNELLRSYEQITRTEAQARLDHLEFAGEDAVVLRRQIVTAWSAKDGIIAFAKAEEPDLIVMSTHGHGPVARFFLGSVARSVIAEAPCPLLCVKRGESGLLGGGGDELRVENIVVPIDFSEDSHRALTLAAEHARLYDAQLHLIYVVHVDIPPILVPEDSTRFLDLNDELRSDISTRLQEFPRDVAPEIEKAVTIVEKGSPAKQIARYAEAHAADLIVISRKGMGRTPHGFGCVTGRLLQAAHCPVLVR